LDPWCATLQPDRGSFVVDDQGGSAISLQGSTFDRGDPRHEDDVVAVEYEPDRGDMRPAITADRR
jgi:hypothetical protein